VFLIIGFFTNRQTEKETKRANERERLQHARKKIFPAKRSRAHGNALRGLVSEAIRFFF